MREQTSGTIHFQDTSVTDLNGSSGNLGDMDHSADNVMSVNCLSTDLSTDRSDSFRAVLFYYYYLRWYVTRVCVTLLNDP